MQFNKPWICLWIKLLLNCTYVRTDDHYTTPTVTLLSCLKSTADLDIQGLQEGGMMFIRTDEVYNMQPTLEGDTQYSCSFTDCGIVWGEAFEFVIQRQTTLQTKHDVHLTYRCIPDTNPIDSGDDATKDEGDGLVQRFLYSAQAEMRFYSNETELVTGSFVKLGTNIVMVIRITNNFEDFADLSIKSCTASTIYTYENRCPVDYDLFGLFNKTGMGTVQNEFRMFRPTSLSAGPSDILFSCLLEVCIAPCQDYVCNTTDSRRKKRAADGYLKSVIVGTVFSVGIEDREVIEKAPQDNCVTLHFLAVATATPAFFLILSIATFFYYYCEWKGLPKIPDKIDADSNHSKTDDLSITPGQYIHDQTKLAPNVDLISDRENITTDTRQPISITSTDAVIMQSETDKTETAAKRNMLDMKQLSIKVLILNSDEQLQKNVQLNTSEQVKSRSNASAVKNALIKQIASNNMKPAGDKSVRYSSFGGYAADSITTNQTTAKSKTESTQTGKSVQFKLGDQSNINILDHEVTNFAEPKVAYSDIVKQREDIFTVSKLNRSQSVDKPTLKSALKKSNNIDTGHISKNIPIAENKNTGIEKEMQKTLAVEAKKLIRTAMAMDNGVKHFLMSTHSGRRRSSLQKTDSMKCVLSED